MENIMLDIYERNAFEEAVNQAKKGNVLFITHNEITEIPSSKYGLPSKEQMQNLTILYLKSFKAFIDGVGSLLTWKKKPMSIVIENIEDYSSMINNKHQAIATLALVIDTCRRIALAHNGTFNLIISTTESVQLLEQLVHDIYPPIKINVTHKSKFLTSNVKGKS